MGATLEKVYNSTKMHYKAHRDESILTANFWNDRKAKAKSKILA